MLICLVVAGALAGMAWYFYAALPVCAAHLVWQIKALRIDDRENCLTLFRANRLTGLLVLAALVIGRAMISTGFLSQAWNLVEELGDRVMDNHVRLAITG